MSGHLLPQKLPGPVDNLFITATAYHVILAHALAADPQAAPGASMLLMKRQRDANFRELFHCICIDPEAPFRDVYLLERPGDKYKRRWRPLIDRTRLPSLRRFIDAARPQRLFLFNEDNLDQYAARRVKTMDGKVLAVEDGAVAYTNQRMRYSPLEGLQSKILFGPAAIFVAVEGSSRLIEKYFARFPDHVRPELRGRPISAVPEGGLRIFEKLTWPADYIQRLGLDPNGLRYDAVVLLAHSDNFGHLPGYRSRIREIVKQMTRDGLTLAVSYHPREKRRDWLDLASQGASLIPQAIPSELIYLFNKSRVKVVCGDIGTSLLTAKWMLADVPVISLMDALEIRDPGLRRLFLALGIRVR